MNGNHASQWSNKIKMVLFVLLSLAMVPDASSARDAIALYLQEVDSIVWGRADRTFYIDDYVIKMEIDLDADNNSETLVTSSLDIDGSHGNAWTVFSTIKGGASKIGNIVFNARKFYVGLLGDSKKYGLATFYPSGGGEGGIMGYYITESGIQSIPLGVVSLNRQTMKLEGEEVIAKYLGEKAIIGDKVVRVIPAEKLAEKYGVSVDPRTYREVIAEEMQTAKHGQVTISVPPTQTKPVPVATTPFQRPESEAATTPFPTPAETKSSPPGFPIVPVAIVAAVIVGILIFLLYRKLI